jgi:dolichol-phosphate mannosyltransferase
VDKPAKRFHRFRVCTLNHDFFVCTGERDLEIAWLKGSWLSRFSVSSPVLRANLQANLAQADSRVDLAVVIPTYNERDNISELIDRLDETLGDLRWEVIFVDDDSPDRTADLVREFARLDARVRLVHRIGRRGLASACVEGILASSANAIAVMDADMQHDESVLPRMFEKLHAESLDVVVATRNADGGSMGQFCAKRVLLSRVGKKVSNAICHCPLSDPMSGFFVVNRSFFMEVVHELQSGGFKILVDMLASCKREVRVGEVGYCFRNRMHGESKLDVNTAIEYLFLVTNKLLGGVVPVRFAMFSLVGAVGVCVHLTCLALLIRGYHKNFVFAQICATLAAMTTNFFLNNAITYRDRTLRGAYLISGLMSFYLACSFGAWANVIFARSLLTAGVAWYFAGVAGVVVSSVWNYSISNLFTWQMPQQHPSVAEQMDAMPEVEISR